MAASFPTSVKSFTTKQDNVDTIQASHINDLQDEVVAIETHLIDLQDEIVAIQTHLNDLQDEVVAIQTQAPAEFEPFTPTWTTSGTPPTLGNATLTGRVWKFGKLRWFVINFMFGSTSNPGTGAWSFSLPDEAAAGFTVPVSARVVDVSASTVFAAIGRISGTTVGSIATGVGATLSGTAPFTMAAGDEVEISGCYIAKD